MCYKTNLKGYDFLKIVVLDSYALNPGDLTWDWLEKLGECHIYHRTPQDKILERCQDAEIILTNKTPLTKETLSCLPNLKYIALLSTGYNIVDWEYAKEIGVPVSNIPAYSTNAVAQLTFSLILEITNAVGLHSESVKNGEWTSCPDFCYWKTPLTELCGKTLGVVGFGQIGQAVADIAEAFKMNVVQNKLESYTYYAFKETGGINNVSFYFQYLIENKFQYYEKDDMQNRGVWRVAIC